MSLVFAAFVPHPPIIIPEIGKNNISAARNTISSMKKLAEKFYQAEIDSVVIISPHAEMLSFAMTVFAPGKYQGDFSYFGAPEVKMDFSCEQKLAINIYQETVKAEIPIEIDKNDNSLDHGAMVPLYYLLKNSDRGIKLVEVAFSTLPRIAHLEFGRVIGKIIDKEKENIALVASGDLSHRVFDKGYQEYGEEFDQKIAEIIRKRQLDDLTELDEELIELAGECGYRSLLILAGALKNKKYKSKLLSHEAPFGVGYLVADFEL